MNTKTAVLSQSLSDLVKTDYRTADVFKKHGVGFCCGGNMSLSSACESKKLDQQILITELKEATRNIRLSNKLPFHLWRTDFLIEFIVNVHHEYILRILPELTHSLHAFTSGHSKKYPELIQITEITDRLSAALATYAHQEEEIIFPYVKQMDAVHRRKEVYGSLFVRTMRKPLDGIHHKYTEIHNMLEELITSANQFSISRDFCTSYQVQIGKLKEFHGNITQQLFLEFTYLFPKALDTEQKLLHL